MRPPATVAELEVHDWRFDVRSMTGEAIIMELRREGDPADDAVHVRVERGSVVILYPAFALTPGSSPPDYHDPFARGVVQHAARIATRLRSLHADARRADV